MMAHSSSFSNRCCSLFVCIPHCRRKACKVHCRSCMHSRYMPETSSIPELSCFCSNTCHHAASRLNVVLFMFAVNMHNCTPLNLLRTANRLKVMRAHELLVGDEWKSLKFFLKGDNLQLLLEEYTWVRTSSDPG